MQCKQCRAEYDPQDKFCRNCGIRFEREAGLPQETDVGSLPAAADKSRGRLARRLKSLSLAIVLVSLLIVVIVQLLPGILLPSGKPKDLGVKYSDADFQSILAKTQIVSDAPPVQTNRSSILDEYSGSKDIDWTLTESELTAWMNMEKQPGYWPFENVQIKLHAGNVIEASLSVTPAKLMTFKTLTKYLPQEIQSFLSGVPSDIPVYAKAKVLFTGPKQVDVQMLAFEVSNLPVSGMGVSEEANQMLESILNDVFGQIEPVGISSFTTGEGTLEIKGTWYKEIKRVPAK